MKTCVQEDTIKKLIFDNETFKKDIIKKIELINHDAPSKDTLIITRDLHEGQRIIKADLDEHRAAQQAQEAERVAYREKRERHDLTISNELETIKLALFGNEKLGIAGDHQLITEMHTLLVKGGTIKKFMAWIFGVIMAILSASYLLMKMWKDSK